MENTTKEYVDKILDCYSNMVAVGRDSIKGWKINQRVVSENPPVKLAIPEPVISGEDADVPEFASPDDKFFDLGAIPGKFMNINTQDVSADAGAYHLSPDSVSVSLDAKPVTYTEDSGQDVPLSGEDNDAPNASSYYKETQGQFRDALLEARLVFYSKLKDYGPSWRIFRPASVTDQLEIKATRIRNLEEVGVSYVGEGIYPEFQAIVNYGIVALIQFRLGASLSIDFSVDEAMEWYDKIMCETFDLMCRKNVDYREAWKIMRIGSYTDFILVKLARIKQIEENCGKTTVSEGIDANYMDIINYAVFGLIKLKLLNSNLSSESDDK